MKRAASALFGTLLVLALAAGLIAAAAWANCRWGAGSESLPGWIEAISTFAAFIAAVIAVRYTQRVFAIEQRRDRRLDDERRSAQAARVGAWVGVRTYQRPGDSETPAYGEDLYGYYFRNASELPVSQVQIRIGDHPETIKNIASLAPDPEPRYLTLSLKAVEELGIDFANSPAVTLEFTDAAGVRWIRDGAAPLRPLDE